MALRAMDEGQLTRTFFTWSLLKMGKMEKRPSSVTVSLSEFEARDDHHVRDFLPSWEYFYTFERKSDQCFRFS